MLRRALGALALVLACIQPALGQGVVGGRVLEYETRRPVGCLAVALLDSSHRAVVRTDTREDGTFDLPAPSAGAYRLRFSAFGLQPVETERVSLDASSDSERDYGIALVPHDSLLVLWRGSHGDTVPRVDRRVRPSLPRFPQALLDRGITRGQAILAVVVDARGRADSATAFRLYATDPEILPNALAVAHTSRRIPARAAGVPVCRLVVEPFAIERQSMSVGRP